MNIRFTYLLSLLSATLLAACSDPVDEYLNGEGTPTPLNVSISLSDAVQKVQSRAADKSFAAGDVLLAYFQHIDGNGDNVNADMAPALVTFKVGSNAEASTSDLTVTSIKNGDAEKLPTGQTTLYWDDFSNSTSIYTDLRTTGHGLRTLYGYCFNGKDPAPTISDPTSTGTINWSVDIDQKTNGIQKSDLLWSETPTETATTYVHDPNKRVGIKIPYTHAMSKVTIVLVAGKGFVAKDLEAAKVTLLNMNTVCKTTAPTGDVSNQGTPAPIQMHGNTRDKTTIDDAEKDTRAFEAIVVPGKELTKDLAFATVEYMDGNKYDIRITESIISQFLNKTPFVTGDHVTLESGTNYKLVITLDKQPQTIVATITNWTDVSASGTGAIKFKADITSHDKDNAGFHDGDMITLWRGTANENNTSYDEDGSTNDIIDKATTCTLNGTSWTNDPQIYWPNGSTKYHFRALTKKDGDTYKAFTGEDYNHDSKTDLMVYEGTDLLWGTTAAHNGRVDGSSTNIKEYAKGDPINPRTSTVPMQFEHVMSKVTINLETTDNAAKVDLSKAKVTFSNYRIGGTVSLVDGSCSGNNIVESVGFSATGPDNVTGIRTTVVNGGFFLPQKLDEQSLTTKLTITLNDGTTYSLYLKDCKATDGKVQTGTDSEGKPIYGDAITEWLRGKHYTYTIHLEKEKITFRALVKDWEEAKGSGNATLDWD